VLKEGKILIIEDDKTLNQNIGEYLRNNGFESESAFDGLTAEKLLKDNHYECVIVDINLPLKDGYELCRELRAYNTTTPVLILTAFDELDDKVKGFEMGADDYLTKPFYTRELLARVNALIKRVNMTINHQKVKIKIHDLILDQGNKTVIRANKPITLTPREYNILLKLALAGGDLVSKKELIRDVWGGLFSTNNNTIEVYINFLRNKIDKPFEKPLIKTKIGFGYYLDI
jgi:DNA-binding response OmpR family regulator